MCEWLPLISLTVEWFCISEANSVVSGLQVPTKGKKAWTLYMDMPKITSNATEQRGKVKFSYNIQITGTFG